MHEIENKNVLYRYRAFDKYSEEFFHKKMLFFPSPSTFNDPYDCKVFFYNLKSSEEIRSCFKEHFEGKTLIEQAMIFSGLKNTFNDPSKKAKIIEPHLLPIRESIKRTGVLCLSENNDDILMWSHYSDGHRGYCLEFDKAKLSELGFLGKINYRKTYPYVDDFHSATITVRDLYILSKSEHWSYENEWRLLFDPSKNPKNSGSRHYQYPEKLLTGIIFGCEMSLENRIRIHDWLKNRKNPINYYEAVKKDNEYGLDIKSFSF